MTDWMTLIAATGAAGVGGTGLGGALACKLGLTSERELGLGIGFAAGVMLGVVCFGLLPEALTLGGMGWALGLTLCSYSAIGLGAGALEHSQKALGGFVLALAMALHNIPEGMVLGAGFALGQSAFTNPWALVAVIGLHNIPEGMAVTGAHLAGQGKPMDGWLLSMAAGFPTMVGAVIGFALGTVGNGALCLSLAMASGAMLWVIFSEMLPKIHTLCPGFLGGLSVAAGLLVGIAMGH